MVDIGPWSPDIFDRATYPVKYYYGDFSGAMKGEFPDHQQRDVQDCGIMIDRTLPDVTSLSVSTVRVSLSLLRYHASNRDCGFSLTP
jgi:hypothetical protein